MGLPQSCRLQVHCIGPFSILGPVQESLLVAGPVDDDNKVNRNNLCVCSFPDQMDKEGGLEQILWVVIPYVHRNASIPSSRMDANFGNFLLQQPPRPCSTLFCSPTTL